jgi:hypothetical protein
MRGLTAVFVAAALALGCGEEEAGEDEDGEDEDRAAMDAGTGPPLEQAKLLIEHNATDEDTGFQIFVDGDPWNRLEMTGPDGVMRLEIEGQGSLDARGLTELFMETGEPENAEVPINELLADMPEGKYDYVARGAEDGSRMTATATFSHAIPAGPVIVSPAAGAVVDAAVPFVIEWEPVTETIEGKPVDIVGYELIVEVPETFDPNSFAGTMLDIHAPATVTSLTVPKEFLAPATTYGFEVLAIEKSGNQTLTAGTFETM